MKDQKSAAPAAARIRDTLTGLVAVRSDSGTVLEIQMAEALYRIIREDPYFQAHPELCGRYDGGDPLGRPVVWALKLGRGRRTVILSGHYDAVETSPYGPFEPYALQPEPLRQKMLESGLFSGEVLEHLKDENWMFGRGAADMKAGDAINLHLLREFVPGEKSLLVTFVCDEENLSAGARQAIGLYRSLKERYGLKYVYAAITESASMRCVGPEDPLVLVDGSGGKILPVAVVKGRLAHAAYVMNGLNSALVLAEIIREVDLNTAFLSGDQGMFNQPPSTQIFSDLKRSYDVSTPEYSAAGFNLTFYGADPPSVQFERIKEVCVRAAERCTERYNEVYRELTESGRMNPSFHAELHPLVLTLSELKERLGGVPAFPVRDLALRRRLTEDVRSGALTMQKAGILYIRELMELIPLPEPCVVVGVVPPFYPTANIRRAGLDVDAMFERTAQSMAQKGYRLERRPYSGGITDASYLCCVAPESCAEIMENMAIPETVYSVDFAALAELSVPTQIVGPAGRNVHQLTERVYLPDVEEHIPCLLRELIRQA